MNKCSTERSQAKIVDNHLTEIQKETEFNKASLERSISWGDSTMRNLAQLDRLLDEGRDFAQINQITLKLLNLGGVYLRKNAYKNLIETGDVRFMKNFESKQKIIDLYEYYEWVEGFNQISLDLYQRDFYPYLRDNFDLRGGSVQKDEVYTSSVYKNNLAAYYRTSQNRLDKYKECLIEVDSYLVNTEAN